LVLATYVCRGKKKQNVRKCKWCCLFEF